MINAFSAWFGEWPWLVVLQFSGQVKAWALAGQGTEEREHVPVFAKEEEKMKRQKLARLQTLATALNYPLTPLP